MASRKNSQRAKTLRGVDQLFGIARGPKAQDRRRNPKASPEGETKLFGADLAGAIDRRGQPWMRLLDRQHRRVRRRPAVVDSVAAGVHEMLEARGLFACSHQQVECASQVELEELLVGVAA